jgi:hypothetical protein
VTDGLPTREPLGHVLESRSTPSQYRDKWFSTSAKAT